MSGGFFDYNQYRIHDIIDGIERELASQGELKPRDELYYDEEYYKEHPEEKVYFTHPIEIQEKMREAIKHLKIAEVYAQRVDWYLSGDDGEENFLKRLKEDLENLNEKDI